MKRISGIKRTLITHGFAAILLGFAAYIPVASAANEAIVQSASGVPYVSGGIGEASIDHLNALARDFNLKLVFALNAGDYVSDVSVSITNGKGQTLVDATSEGPWFYARLPAGKYQVVARFNGKTLKRQVTVGSAKLSIVDFRWAAQ